MDEGRAGQRRPARFVERSRHFEEVVGVVRGTGAGIEHQIIAGSLALLTKLPGGIPNQRIPPVDGRGHLGQKLYETVPATYVRELVKEHTAASFLGPIICVGRKNDHGSHDPARDGHHGAIRPEKEDGLFQTHTPAEPANQTVPCFIGNDVGSERHEVAQNEAEGKPQKDQ